MSRARRKQELTILRWSNNGKHNLSISGLLRKRLVHQVRVSDHGLLYVDQLYGVLSLGPDGIGDDTDGEGVLGQVLVGRSYPTLL